MICYNHRVYDNAFCKIDRLIIKIQLWLTTMSYPWASNVAVFLDEFDKFPRLSAVREQSA